MKTRPSPEFNSESPMEEICWFYWLPWRQEEQVDVVTEIVFKRFVMF